MTNHLVNLIISYLIIFWIFLNVKRSYVNPVSEKMKTLSSSYFLPFCTKIVGKIELYFEFWSRLQTHYYTLLFGQNKTKLYFWIQLYHVSFVIYRYKITCRMKKKNKFSVHTHSPRIVSNEILYSKILTLVQWVKIIIQNAYKLYKFLVFGLFLNILLMFCNTPFLGTIYNFSFIFHTRIWLFTEGHFKVWCIFFNVYMRCF